MSRRFSAIRGPSGRVLSRGGYHNTHGDDITVGCEVVCRSMVLVNKEAEAAEDPTAGVRHSVTRSSCRG